jgi:hypothetical protein
MSCLSKKLKVILKMDNKEFAKNLEDRTRRFAVSIIRLSVSLPKTPEGLIIRNQITKSGTSIGANYRVRQIGLEAKLILGAGFEFAKARQVKRNTGSKSLWRLV